MGNKRHYLHILLIVTFFLTVLVKANEESGGEDEYITPEELDHILAREGVEKIEHMKRMEEESEIPFVIKINNLTNYAKYVY